MDRGTALGARRDVGMFPFRNRPEDTPAVAASLLGSPAESEESLMKTNARLLLLSAALATACFSLDAGAVDGKAAKAEVPPPPGLNDPGVDTSAPARDPGAPPAQPAPPVDDDPLAPLPKPDARLVRDKASRDRAATAERVATSDVTTRQQGEDTIEEYRQNGRLWMIKIRQPRGPVQTFYADDGSGQLVRDPKEGPVSPVYFTLYEWK